MKRQAGFLATLVLLSGTIALFAQGTPNPALPSDILGPQLIAWSLLQNPQPVARSQESQEVTPLVQPNEPAAQTFTGTIGKDGGRYVLKVSNNTAYQLDDQERARQYEGKQVRVEGTLSPKDNSLHVLNIELIS